MKKRLFVLSIIMVISVMVISCGLQNLPQGQTPIAIYTSTRIAFNDYLSSYLAYRDVMPAGAERDALKTKFEPKLETAKQYLDAWKAFLGAPTERQKMLEFQRLFNGIVMELIQAGIVKPQKGG